MSFATEDPRIRHARALLVLAVFILVAGQVLWISQHGWSFWMRMGDEVLAGFRGKPDYASLVFDGLCVTSVALVLAAPVFLPAFVQNALLRWTARILAAGTWLVWLSPMNRWVGGDGAELSILLALGVLLLGFGRLCAPASRKKLELSLKEPPEQGM
ncbi:hypothetical protein [Luteolibacter sp. LG18]|uniref:hypothetical protein n=1 Tax=Luteolibacter sp. LG18 TaxID=2819286 RepID=UPI002B2E5B94|nr:hypothetical protein llg_42340 [Luteolibacter sp. LG18]